MGFGITINKETGGSNVNSSNPLPVYIPIGWGAAITDGTRFVDVPSGGTANSAWNEGLPIMRKQTDGTWYPWLMPVGTAITPVTLTSTTVSTAVTAPASGSSIFVTALQISNTSATLTRVDVRDGATVLKSMALAASGGGFVARFDPPWRLANAAALTVLISVAVTDVRVNGDYYVAPTT